MISEGVAPLIHARPYGPALGLLLLLLLLLFGLQRPRARGCGYESRGRTSHQLTGSREQQREPLRWEVRDDRQESEQALDRVRHVERELEDQRELRWQAERKLAAADEKVKQLELDLASVRSELTRQQARSQALGELLACAQEQQRAERARSASLSSTQSSEESDGGSSSVTSDVQAAAEGACTGYLISQGGTADKVFRHVESQSCGWLHPTQAYKQPPLILRFQPERNEDEAFWPRVDYLLAFNAT